MNESVVFDYNEFKLLFPELDVNPSRAEMGFSMAEGILNNTPASIVCCECKRAKGLYLLTAHILTLLNRGAGNIGTISSASEGSVSVSYSTSSVDKLGAGWFGQTQYGLLFWQMFSSYRSGFLVI